MYVIKDKICNTRCTFCSLMIMLERTNNIDEQNTRSADDSDQLLTSYSPVCVWLGKKHVYYKLARFGNKD